TGSPVTFTATGTAGSAGSIAVSAGDQQTATVNTAVATPPAVIVKDQFGNPVAGAAVTFAIALGQGGITGAAQTTNASGIARVGSWTVGRAAGTNTLTATSTGVNGSPVTFTATAIAGAATSIAVSAGNNQSAAVGTAVATPPAVIVQDQGDNRLGRRDTGRYGGHQHQRERRRAVHEPVDQRHGGAAYAGLLGAAIHPDYIGDRERHRGRGDPDCDERRQRSERHHRDCRSHTAVGDRA